jgi:hypothetical protein
MLGWLCAAVAAIAIAPTRTCAQFQHLYGSGNVETGLAVVQTSDGGYLAAGTHDNGGSGTTYGYVTRTDAAGTLLWDRVFYPEPSSTMSFADVKACANGDFILVGSTASAQPCASGCAKALAMRIDGNGTLLWEQTYGNFSLNYYASSVVETQYGNGTTTNAGDFAIAGYEFDYNNQGYNGVLMRLTSRGDVIWKKLYDIDPRSTTNTLTLYGVDETRYGANTGDIVAAGQAYFATTGVDVAVLRVDGSDGTFGAAPQGFATFDASSNDHGFSITELRNGNYAGDLVITGTSSSRAPYNGYEVLMLETYPDPCDPSGLRADQFMGDNFVGGDIGFCVREITDPANGTPGDVIVAGISQNPYWAPSQATLTVVLAGTMTPSGSMQAYGGSGNEWGYGVAECASALGAPGFVLTGSSTSASQGLYMVRTDAALAVPCSTSQYDPHPAAAGLRPVCRNIAPVTLPVDVACGIQQTPTDWGNDICHLTGVPPKRVAPEDDESAPEKAPGDDGDAIAFYPNPIRAGDAFTVEMGASAAGSGGVLVSDIAGRTVYEGAIDGASPKASVRIGTEGWAPGSYVIRVDIQGRTRTGRITVVAR